MEIHDYQKVYEKLKNGEEVIPVSREEALMMALIGKIGGSGGESERSLKTLLDFTKSTSYLFNGQTELESIGSDILKKTDTSEVTNMVYMFYNCTSLKTIPELDTSKVTDMSGMFSGCESLESIPEMDTSNVTNMNSTFMACKSLKTDDISNWNTSRVVDINWLFSGCESLESIPELDTSSATKMAGMFDGCTSIKTIPLLDTSNVTDMERMFYDCESLESIPELDTSKVEGIGYMFKGCTALKTVPELDFREAYMVYSVFNGCVSLETCLLRNIKERLDLSDSPLLTLNSLLHLIKELRDTGSSKTLTVGTANLEKLADIYVKTIDITDEMRADDDLIDEKLPFEVCESTDEGAMLITSYVIQKNWTLA